VKGELEVKATNVAAFVRNVEIEAEGLAQRAKDLQARAKRAKTLADGMKAYLARDLLRCDVKEVKHDGLRVCLVKNPPAVEIVDAAKVPEDFMRTPEPAPPPEPDRDKPSPQGAQGGARRRGLPPPAIVPREDRGLDHGEREQGNLVGNLGRDPETRYMPDGAAITNMSIATTEAWKDKNGEKQEKDRVA
jgi:hypothetical protein